MKKFLNPKWIIISLFIIAICFYFAILIIAKQQLFGNAPTKNKFATVEKPVQIAMQQYCTGIFTTPQNTWLISRDENGYYSYDRPKTSFNLNSLLPPKEELSAMSRYLGIREDKSITYISKLDTYGKFQEVARLDGTACLVAPPDGKNLLLLTDVNTPYKPEEQHQFAVLRSDDQGKSWFWQKEGFFMPVYFQAWTLRPTIYNSENTWIWKEDLEDNVGKKTYLGLEVQKPSGLYFSADLGKTTETIITSAPLYLSLQDLKTKAPKDVEWQNQETGDVAAFITQWEENQATLWVSQTYRYSKPSSIYIDGAVHTTAQVKLQRIEGHWKMMEVKHLNGVAINHLNQNGQGQFIAIQSFDDNKREQVAVLNKNDLSWKIQGALPQPFSPFNDSTSTQYAWATGNSLIISTVSSHQIYRILLPSTWFDPKEIADVTAFSTYVTYDLGKSWHKLAIEAPNGVFGVNQKTNQAFWTDGAWYSNTDLNIYAHALK